MNHRFIYESHILSCHHHVITIVRRISRPAAEKKPATAPKVHLREGQERFGHLPKRAGETTGDGETSVAMEKNGGFECIPNI